MKVNKSKCAHIKMVEFAVRAALDSPSAGQSLLAKDFTHSHEHRYKVQWSKNFHNIAPPSATLHISGLPPECTAGMLAELFKKVVQVEDIKMFSSRASDAGWPTQGARAYKML